MADEADKRSRSFTDNGADQFSEMKLKLSKKFDSASDELHEVAQSASMVNPSDIAAAKHYYNVYA